VLSSLCRGTFSSSAFELSVKGVMGKRASIFWIILFLELNRSFLRFLMLQESW
jgi:hypothetical protein